MPVAALLLLASGVRTPLFSELVPGIVGIVLDSYLTVLWVVGITASFSILDHMDGLCAGIAAVSAGFFTISACLNGQTMVGTLGAAVLGAALGFLMATLGLKMRPEGAHAPVTWLVPVLILGVPIFDTTLVSISRARRGLLPFTSSGKDHTAHRLSNLGLGHRGAVLALYALAALFGALALLIPHLAHKTPYLLAGIAAVGGLVAVRLLEGAPYQRQAKPAVAPSVS
jgi:UDP-GlcNAc:undecaprenyl-phosphate GlcNAc-1-phosphate transferase